LKNRIKILIILSTKYYEQSRVLVGKFRTSAVTDRFKSDNDIGRAMYIIYRNAILRTANEVQAI